MSLPKHFALNPVALILFSLLLVGCKDNPVEPGVSEKLAASRKSYISNLNYELYFEIPRDKNDSIPAAIKIVFDLEKIPNQLLLDFKDSAENIQKITLNDKLLHSNSSTVSVSEKIIQYGHIILPGAALYVGKNEARIQFLAGEGSLNRNPEFLYTLLVPDRASDCFPSFDQPDLKASFQLSLKIPPDWEAVSNGSKVSLDSSLESKTIKFSKADHLSTYQFAFAAGKFQKLTHESGMTMYYRENDSKKVRSNVDVIFSLHTKALRWMEEYTGIQYPYPKLDFALLPPFQYGGMEHPGSIFYKEGSLFLDEGASINEQLSRASLISHEVAHMWFGNLVTMKWFSDVWLKEVFANLMAAKMVNPSFPEINHELRFLLAHYPSAYAIDRTAGANPIQQNLPNLNMAGTVYGAIIYQKAPIMMRNLESMMGEENFRKGLSSYLKKYQYANASWDDLLAVLSKQTNKNLNDWNSSWIKQPGMPGYHFSLSKGSLEVSLMDPSRKINWPQSIQVSLLNNSSDTFQIDLPMSGSQLVIKDQRILPGSKIIPNSDSRGYGYFKLDQIMVEDALSSIHKEVNPVRKAGTWIMLWEEFLQANVHPEYLANALLQGIQSEKNPLILDYISSRFSDLYWKFLPSASRSSISASAEEVVLNRLDTESNISVRRTLFNLFRSIATTENGTRQLKSIWMGKRDFGLKISESDRMNLALGLSLRLPSLSDSIIDVELNRLTNPDRKAQLQFISTPVSPSVSSRTSFFNKLKNPAERVQEPWVLEGLRYLHHPTRVDESFNYLGESLNMLEEIQQTGDIFFPKGWLEVSLTNHYSDAALKVVDAYLAARPDLSPFLRRAVLQSIDQVKRANTIRRKFFKIETNK
ncbi:MAG: ERAP1-like C-terminal domain-containing protein [Bacteroidetes bacterium]|nr:ERAP1-like C-terminal domain-containing protein [Bacteroidota bacterium]